MQHGTPPPRVAITLSAQPPRVPNIQHRAPPLQWGNAPTAPRVSTAPKLPAKLLHTLLPPTTTTSDVFTTAPNNKTLLAKATECYPDIFGLPTDTYISKIMDIVIIALHNTSYAMSIVTGQNNHNLASFIQNKMSSTTAWISNSLPQYHLSNSVSITTQLRHDCKGVMQCNTWSGQQSARITHFPALPSSAKHLQASMHHLQGCHKIHHLLQGCPNHFHECPNHFQGCQHPLQCPSLKLHYHSARNQSPIAPDPTEDIPTTDLHWTVRVKFALPHHYSDTNSTNWRIADTGASRHYLHGQALYQPFSTQCTPTGVSIANGDCITTTGQAILPLPHLQQGTNTCQIMQEFENNLLSMGLFCDAGCTVVFSSTDVKVFDKHNNLILQGFHELEGPRMWRFNLLPNHQALTTSKQLECNVTTSPHEPSTSMVPTTKPFETSTEYHRRAYNLPSTKNLCVHPTAIRDTV